MSRLFAIFVSLLYIVGGFATGVYVHATYLQGNEMLATWLQNKWAVWVPVFLLIALALHLSQIFKARDVVDKQRKSARSLKGDLALNQDKVEKLEKKVADDETVLEFCRGAIADAKVREILETFEVPPFEELDLYKEGDIVPKPGDDPDDSFDMSRLRAVKVYHKDGDGPEIKRQAPPKDYVAGAEGEESIKVT